MRKYIRLTEDKTRFINQLPWDSEEEKNKVLDFFKSHSNLESKIKSWQSRDKDATVQEIRDFISETNAKSLEKEKSKEGYRGNIDWESHDCKYLGEDEKWIYVTPLSYEGAKFCDSAECGGAGAKWCIGYEQDDAYWNRYTNKGALFLMKFNKYPIDKQNDLKYMIEGYLNRDTVSIWNQPDKSIKYNLSEKEKEYLVQIKKISEEQRKKILELLFDNPESGVYIAKDIKAFNHIEYIKKYLKVFKVKEGLDCSSITDTQLMFDGCESLQSIDASAFKNVTDAGHMFHGCASLRSIDTSAFKNVINAQYMFYECKSLQSIDTSAFKNVKDAQYMFYGCKSLRSIDASVFTNVEFSYAMFCGCESLQSIDTSAFTNVEYVGFMFAGCKSLQSIDASAFKNVMGFPFMFKGCSNIKTYIPSGNPEIDSKLEELGAKPVRSLSESSNKIYWRECLEEMMYL